MTRLFSAETVVKRPLPTAPKIHPQKLRGGYYTPETLTSAMAMWAIRERGERVFEPSAGNGNFVVAAADALIARGTPLSEVASAIVAVELDPTEAKLARDRLVLRTQQSASSGIITGDFFGWYKPAFEKSFDAVLGNPPFIRYQNFPEPSRARAMKLLSEKGFRPNRLTNMWVPFVVGATELLKPEGRLALVVPAEILQVTYAAQLRSYLVDSFKNIEIIACNQMFFERAEQEVVLLLASQRLKQVNPNNNCQVSLQETDDLESVKKLLKRKKPKASETKSVHHDSEKWLKYFLSAKEIQFMRSLRNANAMAALSAHAEVDVGVVTGENDFFVISKDQAETFGLMPYCVPLISRSSQLKGIVVDKAEWIELSESGSRCHLINLPPEGLLDQLPGIVRQYIAQGEALGVNKGYKCSIRKPWYTVPSVWQPDCFMFRQIHDFPRVVLNRVGATSTDTIHRLTCAGDKKLLTLNLLTYLTAASAEIEGRSYGGGVLELEPTEAERLLVPAVLQRAIPLDEADSLVRQGRLAEALSLNSEAILCKGLGLSKTDVMLLASIWEKMMSRRVRRRRGNQPASASSSAP